MNLKITVDIKMERSDGSAVSRRIVRDVADIEKTDTHGLAMLWMAIGSLDGNLVVQMLSKLGIEARNDL